MLGFALSGCALQADVMELGTNMEEVEGLQRKLETQLEGAEEAIETVGAMRVRMETVEEKLREGVDPELEARINVALKTQERSQRQLAKERLRANGRLDEAETFFIEQVKQVSARQKRSEDRVAAMEARLGGALKARSGASTPSGQSTPGDDPYLQWLDERLSGLSDQVRTLSRLQEEAKKAPEETPVLLDPRVDELTAKVTALRVQVAEAAPAAQGPGPDGEALEKRIAALEAQGAVDANEVVQRRMDQIAEATDVRLAQMAEQQASQAQPLVEVVQHQARQDQVLALLDQRLQALGVSVEGATGPTAVSVVQLAQRVDASELATRTELTALRAAVQRMAAGGVARSPGETAALAGLSGQMELLAASLGERISLLEQAASNAPPPPSSSVNEGALVARIAAMEPVLAQLNHRLLSAEQAQMADMTAVREQLAGLSSAAVRAPETVSEAVPNAEIDARLARQEQAYANLERRFAALQTDPQVAFLTERLETLSSNLERRLGALETGGGGETLPSRRGDAAGIASLSGQIALLEASLSDRMARLEEQISQPQEETPQVDPVLAGKVARQDDALSRLNQRVSALQADPQGAFLAQRMERIERLTEDVNARLASLSEQAQPAQQAPSRPAPRSGPDPAAMAGLSGQMALLEANLGKRIGRLEKGMKAKLTQDESADSGAQIDRLAARFDALGDRIGGLEQAQMKDLGDLRQQIRQLAEALSRQRGGGAP